MEILSHSVNTLRKYAILLGVLSALFFATGNVTYAADIVFSPNATTYLVGKSYVMEVRVANNQGSINAVSGTVSFPTALLEVTSVSKSGSIVNTWAEDPSFSNENGSVNFEGVILNPGFSGSSGKVLTITFKAKANGTANMYLKSGTVLANDGNATNVLGTLGTATIEIKESKTDVPPAPRPTSTVSATPSSSITITSSSFPDSNKWYSSRNASFSWNVPSDVTAVRTLYTEKETATPNKVYDPAITERSFDVDSDGIFYIFVQGKTEGGWGAIARYKFQIDTKAPTNLDIHFSEGTTLVGSAPTVTISAVDSLSGVDHFGISIDNGKEINYPVSSSNLYSLPESSPGSHTIKVVAYDKAGNSTEESATYTIQAVDAPVITSYSKEVKGSDRFAVSGKSYPKTTVEAILTDINEQTFSQKALSQADGTFNLVWEDALPVGMYGMRVRVNDEKYGMSSFTDQKMVQVENSFLVRIGGFILNWLSLILILLIALVGVGAAGWFAVTKAHHILKRYLLKHKKAAISPLQSFYADVKSTYAILVKAQKQRKLTAEEEKIMKKLKKQLTAVEEEVKKSA